MAGKAIACGEVTFDVFCEDEFYPFGIKQFAQIGHNFLLQRRANVGLVPQGLQNRERANIVNLNVQADSMRHLPVADCKCNAIPYRRDLRVV